MIEKLKAQYSAAKENARVDDYYVIPRADDQVHRKRVRSICSELKNYRGCTVIEPRDAFGFFQMSGLELVIRTTRLLCNSDTILRAALAEMDSEEPATAFFIVSLVCHAFERGVNVSPPNLRECWSDWSDLVGSQVDQLANVISALSNDRILEYDGSGYVIDVTQLSHSICALFFDLRVRNLANDAETRDYIVGLLDLRDRATAELSD
jgi:hypothetical protein